MAAAVAKPLESWAVCLQREVVFRKLPNLIFRSSCPWSFEAGKAQKPTQDILRSLGVGWIARKALVGWPRRATARLQKRPCGGRARRAIVSLDHQCQAWGVGDSILTARCMRVPTSQEGYHIMVTISECPTLTVG